MTEQSSCSTLNLRNRTMAPMAHLKDYPRGRVAEKSVDPGIEDGSSVNVVIHNYLEISLVLGRFSEENVRDLLELSRAAASRRRRHSWTRDQLHER